MIRCADGFALTPQLLVQLLAGACADEPHCDVVRPRLAVRLQARLLAGEADHVAGEIENLHRLAHVEHEDLAAAAD